MERFKDSGTWKTITGLLLAILIVGPLGNRIWDWPNVWPAVGVCLIASALIVLWREHVERISQRVAKTTSAILSDQQLTEDAKHQFAICKSTTALRPEDMAFQEVIGGEIPDPHFRPFNPSYFSRGIVPLGEASAAIPSAIYRENDLVRELEQGRDFVILGPPTAGKSRTVYEISRLLQGWTAIAPKKDEPTPPTSTFQRLFRGKKVLLLLEDLNDYVGARVDLSDFCGPNGLGLAERWVIAATCRDGPELSAVGESFSSSLRRIFDDIPLKLELLPQTLEEKTSLANSVASVEWDASQSELFPTPGTIVMENALRFMRGRYDRLSSRPDRRDTLRAIKMLASAGILPLSHQRISLVLATVAGRQGDHLSDTLEFLSSQAFIRQPGNQDPVLTEPAYFQDSVIPVDEALGIEVVMPKLVPALERSLDADALTMLGLTCALTLHRDDLAVVAYDAALRVEANHYIALNNRGSSLNRLSRHEEALQAIGRLLESYPFFVPGLVNRGVAMAGMGRMADALEAYEAALRLEPHNRVAFTNRGTALIDLDRPSEALKVLQSAVSDFPDHADAHMNLGRALLDMDRSSDALQALNRAIALDPQMPLAHARRGIALGSLGHHEQALASFDEALRLDPNNQIAWLNRGVALGKLGNHEKALEAWNVARNSRKDDPDIERNRGVAFNHLYQFDEAIKALGLALSLRPNDPNILFHRGVALWHLGRLPEARDDFTRAVALQPDWSEARSALDKVTARMRPEEI